MTSFTIISRRADAQADPDALVIADRFTWLGFLLGGIWLLWHRVWFIGALVLIADIAIGVAMTAMGQHALFYALDLALALLVGLEGQNWRIDAAVAKGGHIADVVEANDRELAFDRYAYNAATYRQTPPPLPEVTQAARPRSLPVRASGNDMIGLVSTSREN